MSICSWLLIVPIFLCLLPACEVSTGELPGTIDVNACRIQMLDNRNEIDTIIQAEEVRQGHYIVTDKVNTVDEWSVDVYLRDNRSLKIEAGVRDVDYQGLIDNYVMESGSQLTFLAVAGYACTEFETSLIYFLIMEWFYFG